MRESRRMGRAWTTKTWDVKLLTKYGINPQFKHIDVQYKFGYNKSLLFFSKWFHSYLSYIWIFCGFNGFIVSTAFLKTFLNFFLFENFSYKTICRIIKFGILSLWCNFQFIKGAWIVWVYSPHPRSAPPQKTYI